MQARGPWIATRSGMWVWLAISFVNVFDFQEQNFDILTGYDNEPIIAFHLPSTVCEDSSVSQNLGIKTDSAGIEVLNGLCNEVRHFRRILFFMTHWQRWQNLVIFGSQFYSIWQVLDLPNSCKYWMLNRWLTWARYRHIRWWRSSDSSSGTWGKHFKYLRKRSYNKPFESKGKSNAKPKTPSWGAVAQAWSGCDKSQLEVDWTVFRRPFELVSNIVV